MVLYQIQFEGNVIKDAIQLYEDRSMHNDTLRLAEQYMLNILGIFQYLCEGIFQYIENDKIKQQQIIDCKYIMADIKCYVY